MNIQVVAVKKQGVQSTKVLCRILTGGHVVVVAHFVPVHPLMHASHVLPVMWLFSHVQ